MCRDSSGDGSFDILAEHQERSGESQVPSYGTYRAIPLCFVWLPYDRWPFRGWVAKSVGSRDLPKPVVSCCHLEKPTFRGSWLEPPSRVGSSSPEMVGSVLPSVGSVSCFSVFMRFLWQDSGEPRPPMGLVFRGKTLDVFLKDTHSLVGTTGVPNRSNGFPMHF